ncbi:YicC family protein [Myxococcota bacterium]|nr:YicC family protein [Myxococcota bacterium]
MIHSMTGFGRSRFDVAGRTFDVEIRSVNHRHIDMRVRLPRFLAEGESLVKSMIQKGLGRGKVDVVVAPSSQSADLSAASVVQVDEALADRYLAAARSLARRGDLKTELDVSTLMTLPGVTKLAEMSVESDELEKVLRVGVQEALDALVAMRAMEGEGLSREILGRLEIVENLVEDLSARADQVLEAAKERLRKRTEQIRQDTGLLDEARLHQEIVIAADRLDITEELVRLRSHIEQFRTVLGGAREEGPVGRRLDFLLLQFGREANTVGSKGSDASIAHQVVELKSEIERIREQVQNIE